MHLVIRADGGPDIGFGHLVRTGALAEYALDNGDDVTYATTTPEHAVAVCPSGVRVVTADPDRPTESFTSWLETADVDAVLTDSYDVDTADQRTIRDAVPFLAVVLDDTRFAVCADLLVNGNVYAPSLRDEYEFEGPPATTCLGLDYLLLREEMREATTRDPPWRDPPERVLVTMGGSDIRGVTPDVISAFEGVDLEVTVVVGPGFTNGDEIRVAATRVDADVTVVETPENLPELMLDADLAVSATGSTTYELLATGTPTVGLPQADNQWPIATALREQGALFVPADEDPASIRETVRSLTTDTERRRAMREVGRTLVDGRGVERVYRQLTELGEPAAEVRE